MYDIDKPKPNLFLCHVCVCVSISSQARLNEPSDLQW